MRHKRATPDAAVAQVAARQHGVITIGQLRGAGLSAHGVKRRVGAGRLHRIHRGVYAVGHAGLSRESRWMAAVKACGEGAALSHRSAAELWALLSPRAGLVHVTVPGYAGRGRRDGIRIHRSSSLTEAVTTARDRIPVTDPARTISDLRRTADPDTVRRAIRQAEVLGLPLGDAVGHSDRTRSELERRFLAICRRHRLPRPEVNVRVGAFLVDFLWRDQRLIVETDGYRPHRGRQAFEDDRARDVALKLRGYEVARFTYRQVMSDAAGVAAAVRGLLRRSIGETGG